MATQLIKYEAACHAITECVRVDEVKEWADKAAAMQAYGRMAKDQTLQTHAAEIRIRAERRLGELLVAQKADGGLNPAASLKRGPVVVSNDHGEKPATLADAGISKDLSSRAQKLAAVPEQVFEAELAAKRERDLKDGARVSARLERAGARELQKAQEAPGPVSVAHDDFDPLSELEKAQAEIESLGALLKAAEAEDLKAEALKWRRCYDSAVRAQSEAMERASKYEKELNWYGNQFKRVCKAMGETDPSKVAARVEALVRGMKEAA
jgi:hypothetical protein